MVRPIMNKYDWDRLNPLQIGKYAEYFVKMEFTLYGFDVYTSEVDDKGIDFIICNSNHDLYFDIQVKSVRNFNYIFFRKEYFAPRRNLLAAIVIFINYQAPVLYLIPSLSWLEKNSLFVSRDYEPSLKSKPEWGLNLSKKNWGLLSDFEFEKAINSFLKNE